MRLSILRVYDVICDLLQVILLHNSEGVGGHLRPVIAHPTSLQIEQFTLAVGVYAAEGDFLLAPHDADHLLAVNLAVFSLVEDVSCCP